MADKHQPHKGSKAFYPRKRAKKEVVSFRTFAPDAEGILNFYGYKVGMAHIYEEHKIDRATHKKLVPITLIEVPDLDVIGLRILKDSPSGKRVVKDYYVKNLPEEIGRKTTLDKAKSLYSIEQIVEELKKNDFSVDEFRLICSTNPKKAHGKKKPEIVEIRVKGELKDAISKYLGKKLTIDDFIGGLEYIDVKGVTKGKGTQGVVKRFGVFEDRRKSQKHRDLGSLGPWHPATVMHTVMRPGKHGYYVRTEYNKRVIKLLNEGETLEGLPKFFKHYGILKNKCLVVEGTIPGPAKRIVCMRKAIRA